MPVIKIRRGTTTQWNASSRVLQVGELGIDTTLNKIKAGGYSFFMGTIYKLKLDNVRMIEIPIIFDDRHYGKSKIPKIEIFRTLFNLIKILLKKSL